MTIPSGLFDVVYPAGDLTNAHMTLLVNSYWNGQTVQLDLMTSATQVVTVAGYSQQTYANWGITSEAD